MALFWHSCFSVASRSAAEHRDARLYRYGVTSRDGDARQFADLYALAQAAPGPNASLGDAPRLQAAGWTGAVATTLGALIPATVFSPSRMARCTRSTPTRRSLSPSAAASRRWRSASCWRAGGCSCARSARLEGYTLAFRHLPRRHRDAPHNPQWLMAAGLWPGSRPLIS